MCVASDQTVYLLQIPTMINKVIRPTFSAKPLEIAKKWEDHKVAHNSRINSSQKILHRQKRHDNDNSTFI